MNLKITIFAVLLCLSSAGICQTDKALNQTDPQGRKQGHWIKRAPNKTIIYDGYFKDDKPAGKFKRYYENDTLKSVLNFTADGKEASAVLYHPNSYLASKGKYINQLKEANGSSTLKS